MKNRTHLHYSGSPGFTLIELLVVIAIIGLLSSVILASLNTARAKSRDARRVADMKQIQTALEVYYDAVGSYPNPGWAWHSQCVGWGSYTAANVIPGLTPNYMSSFPSDPGMIPASNVNCYLYLSNGTDYKFLDYNLSADSNPAGFPTLIDPSRNIGQTFQNPNSCVGAAEGTRSFAFFSPGGRCW